MNGVAAASGPITLDPANVAPTLNYLGKSQWPGDPYFNGVIDDFRIYNRALNATEVKSLAAPPAAVVVTNGYTSWAGNFAFATGQDGPETDADNDGAANLIEWLLGTNPLTSTGAEFLSPARFQSEEIGLSDGKTYLGFTARVRKDRTGVTLIPEAAATPDGLAQPDAASHAVQAGAPTDDGDFEIFKWYYNVPIEDGGAGFMRLRVVHE